MLCSVKAMAPSKLVWISCISDGACNALAAVEAVCSALRMHSSQCNSKAYLTANSLPEHLLMGPSLVLISRWQIETASLWGSSQSMIGVALLRECLRCARSWVPLSSLFTFCLRRCRRLASASLGACLHQQGRGKERREGRTGTWGDA